MVTSPSRRAPPIRPTLTGRDHRRCHEGTASRWAFPALPGGWRMAPAGPVCTRRECWCPVAGSSPGRRLVHRRGQKASPSREPRGRNDHGHSPRHEGYPSRPSRLGVETLTRKDDELVVAVQESSVIRERMDVVHSDGVKTLAVMVTELGRRRPRRFPNPEQERSWINVLSDRLSKGWRSRGEWLWRWSSACGSLPDLIRVPNCPHRRSCCM